MKKLIPVLACAALVVALTGCSTKATNTETYNGISKITTTEKTDGQEVTTIEYKDKDGNVLDAELGEAAFQAGKDGEADPLAYAEAQMNAESSEPIVASLTFANDSDTAITEMYFVTASAEDWGDNILDEDLNDGEALKFEEALTYYPETEFEVRFVTEDGGEHEFDAFTVGDIDDPASVTLTFIQDDGTYSFYVN